MRAPFQVLILPFRKSINRAFEFAAFLREDADYWQGIAGGGENGESPIESAVREAREEAGISNNAKFYLLNTTCSIPAYHFSARNHWTASTYVIQEHCFAVDCTRQTLNLSREHKKFIWGSYDEIYNLLHWDSNRTAIWELRERLLANALEPLKIK